MQYTFNGMLLRLNISEDKARHSVTLDGGGDRVKTLYDGPDEAEAARIFDAEVQHYMARASNAEQERAEEAARLA